MMRRLFGSKKPKKKRLSPSAQTPEGILNSHPMYRYAMNEYAQTVAPQSSNHDGRAVASPYAGPADTESNVTSSVYVSGPQQSHPTSPGSYSRVASPVGSSSATGAASNLGSPVHPGVGSMTVPHAPSMVSNASTHHAVPKSPENPYIGADAVRHQRLDQVMPDATYEETYGDAYVGGPIRYIYPSGYQSMRPRGGPWKLSIAICVSFTWLSVFIIGHCSSRVDPSMYDHVLDDDTLVIETRWCGSRVLYMMWVVSMLITGLASAYCSIIGYIKMRDFAVANARSQPPGMVGKSDYYVKLDDSPAGSVAGASSEASFRSHINYKKTIYQADGNPQFWGGHIYRPTQAAVAITSR